MIEKEKVPGIKIQSWIISLTLLFTVYYELFVFKPLYPVICTAAAVLVVLFSFNNYKRQQLTKVIVLIIALWLWCVLLAFIQGADKPLKLEALEMMIFGGLVALILCAPKVYMLPYYLVYYIIILFFYYQYFYLQIDTYGVMRRESGAINTIILLTLAVVLQAIDYRDNNRIPVLPSLLILPISIMSWNRTGFFMSLLYIVTVFYVGASKIKIRKHRIGIYIIVSIISVFFIVRYYNWFSNSSLMQKFDQYGVGLESTGRTSIWNAYFTDFGFFQAIFGKPIDDSHQLLGSYTNPHNSFIMLHAQTGLMAFVIIFLMLKKLSQYWKSDKFIFFLFLVIIIRSFFDLSFFFRPYDYAFYFFMASGNNLLSQRGDYKFSII